jgi:polysaccharide biosynthesis/export protein
MKLVFRPQHELHTLVLAGLVPAIYDLGRRLASFRGYPAQEPVLGPCGQRGPVGRARTIRGYPGALSDRIRALAALFVRLTTLTLAGCSMLPSAGPPSASAVVAPAQSEEQILFDVVPVDERVISTLLAQPKESFHARFDKHPDPPELKIAIGDTISVTIWESAAGGLFSEAPAPTFPGSRPTIEPLAPESRPGGPGTRVPAPETPGGSNLPFEQPFGVPSPRSGAPSPDRRPGTRNPATAPFPTETAAAASGRQGATIPDQPIAADGAISVPYAGRVPAAGQTPGNVQQAIEALLADKALEPQALVIVKKSAANAVTVAGEVVAGARVPLSPGGDRLLQAIAAAGGARTPVHETFVRLSRNGVTATIPLERLVADPTEDIYAQPGDILTLVRIPQTFSVFGATGRNAAIEFEAEKITLSEALAKSQGLNDNLANPRGVFLFRYEPVSIIRALDQPIATRSPDGISPVVYRFDLADAGSNFIADRFPVRDKDIIFVADAGAAQVYKIFNVFNNITGPFITGLLTCHYANC